jgi:HEAT repeat protein
VSRVFAAPLLLFVLLCTAAACPDAAAQSASPTETRRDVAARLGASADPNATAALLRLLEDPAEIVRATAAGELGLRGDAAAVGQLGARLQVEKRVFVRKEIASALGRIGDRAAVAPLVARLEREKDREVRAAVVDALGRIGGAETIAPLVARLGDKDDFVRRQAVRALGLSGATGAIARIADRLEHDESADVRRHAAEALGLLGDRAVVPALTRALHDGDPYVAQTAADALERVRARAGV